MAQADNNNLENSPKSEMMVAGFVGFVAIISMAMQSPLLSLFIVDLGATIGLLGIILSARGFIEIILRIPFASTSDMAGRKFLCIIGLVCFTLTPLVLVLAGIMQTWTIIIFALIIQSVGISALWPALIAYVSDLYPPNRSGEALGRLFRWTDFGQIIGPLIAGFLVSSLGLSYTQVFATSFLASFLGSIVALSLFREETIYTTRETVRIFLQEMSDSFNKIRITITNRATIAPNIAVFFFAASVSSLTLFFPILGRDRSLIEAEIGTTMSSRRILAWFWKIKLGMVSDIYGRSSAVVLSLLGISVLLVAIAFTYSFILLVALFITIGVFQAVGFPAINGAIIDVVSENERGTYIGTWGVYFSAGRALSFLMFGIISTFFRIDSAFIFAGIWVALGAVLYQLTRIPIPPTPFVEPMEPVAAFKEVDR